jgi:hypothetical protein
MPEARLTRASAPTAESDMRTAWVCVPVQKKARARPWSSWDTAKSSHVVENTRTPQDAASEAAATTTKTLSGRRRIIAPMKMRVPIWDTADSATRIPTSGAE